MKIRHALMSTVLSLGLASTSAVYAAPPPVTSAAGNLIYLGVKGGLIDIDEPNADNALNIGVYGGYHLLGDQARFPKNLGGGTLSVEGEFTLTAIDGDAGPSGDWSVMTLAGYAAYRFPLQNSFYLKGKAGGYWQDVDTDRPVSWDGTDTGVSVGLGGGWKLSKGVIEAEITLLGSDVTFLSLGYIF